MNLLCPNCQKMLTVPEQYAGQLMKCPLCSGTFTVPALPGAPSVEPAPAFSSPPPAPSVSPSPVVNTPNHSNPGTLLPGEPASPAMADAYGLKHEPEPAFHFPPPVDTPAFSPAPEPAFSVSTPSPAAAPPASPPLAPTPAPGFSAPSSQPVPSTAPAVGYTRTITIWFSERVLQWVPPVAVVLILVFQCFPWVGVYPGGVPAVSQSAWQAGFGGYSEDIDMTGPKGMYPVRSEEDVRKSNESRAETAPKQVVTKPGVSLLTLFYLLPFFLITLIVTLAVAVLPHVKVQLPPQVQHLLPWRWVIVAGLNALVLLFLLLQCGFSFDVESKARDWIANQPEAKKTPEAGKDKKEQLAFIGEREEWIQRSLWLRLVVVLHILATLSAAMVYGIEKRGTSKPLPRLEVMW